MTADAYLLIALVAGVIGLAAAALALLVLFRGAKHMAVAVAMAVTLLCVIVMAGGVLTALSLIASRGA